MTRTALITLIFCILVSCGGHSGQNSATQEGGDTITSEAQLLTLVEHDGWTLAELRSPWDNNGAPARYALVADDNALSSLPEGVTAVKVPLDKSIITSSVHMAVIEEFGALNRISGVTDATYITMPSIKAALASGTIADVGTSTTPTLEAILEIAPDAVLATPYANSDHSALTKMKITVIEMADYMERTPAGRAEWIKLIGRLYGQAAKADSLYAASMAEYRRLASLAASTTTRPMVITEQLISGTWYVPGGASYMARLFADAGARYPFADDTSSGSLALDFATVFDRAGEADYWLLKTYGTNVTLDALKADYPLNARMKAWRTGGVYAANTAECGLYEEFPFHPERLLADYMLIFHPELSAQLPEARYFHQVKP